MKAKTIAVKQFTVEADHSPYKGTDNLFSVCDRSRTYGDNTLSYVWNQKLSFDPDELVVFVKMLSGENKNLKEGMFLGQKVEIETERTRAGRLEILPAGVYEYRVHGVWLTGSDRKLFKMKCTQTPVAHLLTEKQAMRAAELLEKK